jgi:hypothetical protein
LPDLPVTLQFLAVSSRKLESLPALPEALKRLTFDECMNLKSLPALPSGLSSLKCCGCTSLAALPALPQGLKKLWCEGCTSLSMLPALPQPVDGPQAITYSSSLQQMQLCRDTGATVEGYWPADDTWLAALVAKVYDDGSCQVNDGNRYRIFWKDSSSEMDVPADCVRMAVVEEPQGFKELNIFLSGVKLSADQEAQLEKQGCNIIR